MPTGSGLVIEHSKDACKRREEIGGDVPGTKRRKAPSKAPKTRNAVKREEQDAAALERCVTSNVTRQTVKEWRVASCVLLI